MFAAPLMPNVAPVGISTGKFTPYQVLYDSKCLDAELWSDDTTGTHGFLYPTNYASTEQTLINTNITLMQTYYSLDDNSYTTGATKKKIIANYYNSICNITSLALYTPDIDKTYTELHTSVGYSRQVEIATDVIAHVYTDGADSTRLKCKIATLSANGTITFGSAVTIDSTTSCAFPKITYISNNKFAVMWYTSTTIKVAVATVSGSTPTFGSNVNLTTNSNEIVGLGLVGTDKFVGAYVDGTSNDVMCTVCTCTGTTTVTAGSSTLISSAGSFDPMFNSDVSSNGIVNLDTDKFAAFYNSSTQYFYVAVTVSGTTPTPGAEYSLTAASYLDGLWIEKVATDKIMICGTNSAGTTLKTAIITFSGTVRTENTSLTVDSSLTDAGGDASFIQISATKGVIFLPVTISAVTGMYMWPYTINATSNLITVGDRVLLSSTNLTNSDITFIKTTNYTYCGRTTEWFAVRDANIDVTINGTLVKNDTAVKMYEIVSIGAAAYGRKQYIAITNNTANTQKIAIQNCVINAE